MRRQSQSSIDHQAGTVNVARRRTAQEDDVVGNLFHCRGPTKRRELLDDHTQLRQTLQTGLHHRGIFPRGTDGVNTNLVPDIVQSFRQTEEDTRSANSILWLSNNNDWTLVKDGHLESQGLLQM